MNIRDIGFTDSLERYMKENNLSDYTPCRVTQEHRERYIVTTGDEEHEAEITGNLRFSAASRADFPAVGDWVTVKIYEPGMAIIHGVLPRKSVLERQSVSKPGEIQIISANVDAAFIVQSLDINFNINRLERYMTICNSAGIEPVFVISKIDLVTPRDVDDAVGSLKSRHPGISFILLDNLSGKGVDQVIAFMKKGQTYCVVGSSGTGKSTLINNILKENVLKTQPLSNSTNKGKHTTEHRELFVLNNGAVIIDTPGMRELGVTGSSEAVATTFARIHNIALQCRFPDCTHTNEKGCAILQALDNGLIDESSLMNYRRLLREQDHFNETIAERRKKEREFGKMAKRILEEKKKTKR